MDPVTSSLLKDFVNSQQIGVLDEASQFEHFVNYVVLFDKFSEEFDVEAIATGNGEFGIDGIAIIVNDTIIDDVEQLEDLIESTTSVDASFVFTQAKTSACFDAGDMLKFFVAVSDFFEVDVSLAQNEKIRNLCHVKNRLYEYAHKFIRGLPRVALYYASTGTWLRALSDLTESFGIPKSGSF